MNKPYFTTVDSSVKVIIKWIDIIRALFFSQDQFPAIAGLLKKKLSLVSLFGIATPFHHAYHILQMLFQSYSEPPDEFLTFSQTIWNSEAWCIKSPCILLQWKNEPEFSIFFCGDNKSWDFISSCHWSPLDVTGITKSVSCPETLTCKLVEILSDIY